MKQSIEEVRTNYPIGSTWKDYETNEVYRVTGYKPKYKGRWVVVAWNEEYKIDEEFLSDGFMISFLSQMTKGGFVVHVPADLMGKIKNYS